MYTARKTTASTGDFSDELLRLRKALDGAEAVVVGAGAGLSAAAGYTYGGRRFEEHFSDFAAKYGIRDMYSGGFYPFASQEEFWAWWSRHIWVNRYMDGPLPLYEDLLALVRDKDYFVITTNVDHCFQKAGFAKERLFYTQGDYGLFQCSGPCRQETFDNEQAVRRMVEQQRDMRVPTALLPRCPWCGRPMTTNLRADDRFVEDAGWHAAAERYGDFLRTRRGRPVLFLELGVGYNTPGIIKYPFWRMTADDPMARYACVNHSDARCPEQIADRAVCVRGDIGGILTALLELKTQTP